jgi:hypothetical protein
MLPAIQHAIEAIGRQLEIVRLKYPDLHPRQQLQLGY